MMNSKELLEQANNHVVNVNKLMSEVEDFEGVVSEAKLGDVCFYVEGHGTTFIRVLSPEKMQELKATVLDAITLAQKDKTTELEKLLGVRSAEQLLVTGTIDEGKVTTHTWPKQEKRKPAIINPEFEAAVKDMEAQRPVSKAKTVKYPEMTIEAVKKMYHDEAKGQKEIAEYFGKTKSAVNNFIANNHLGRTSYKKDDGFRDAVVEQSRKEHP